MDILPKLLLILIFLVLVYCWYLLNFLQLNRWERAVDILLTFFFSGFQRSTDNYSQNLALIHTKLCEKNNTFPENRLLFWVLLKPPIPVVFPQFFPYFCHPFKVSFYVNYSGYQREVSKAYCSISGTRVVGIYFNRLLYWKK